MPYAVAAGHEKSARVAEEILKAGGNAVDAAIGAYATSFTTEPAMASPGAGAFALVSFDGKKPLAFDFFCHTPYRKVDLEKCSVYPIDVDFGGDTETFYGGLGTMAIPGSVHGMFALHKQYGHMPMTDILEQAVETAKEGVVMNWFQAYDLELLKPVFTHSKTGRGIATIEGRLKKAGDRIAFPEMADFLYTLAREGKDLFYRGEVAKTLIEDSKEHGGQLTALDLESYRTLVTKPLPLDWHGHTLYSFPKPSVGGSIVFEIIRSLQESGDPGAWRSELHLQKLYKALNLGEQYRANAHFEDEGYNDEAVNLRGSTSHLSVLDRKGNAVSMTMTIGEGSGYFIPGTMIHMNNMLGEPSLLPKGLNSWTPNRRLPSMMCPIISVNTEKGYPELIMGTGGASRIPFMLAQVWQNCFQLGMDIEEAVEKPRMHYAADTIHLEKSGDTEVSPEAGEKVNYWDKKSLYFGGVHAICWDGKGQMQAHGDSRREGYALVGKLK